MAIIKYLKNAFSTSGTLFSETSLEAVLKHCLTLPKNGKKSQFGSIFIYNSNALGEHLDNELSTGIILIDIDNISHKTAKRIYDEFELLVQVWNNLLAIQFSSSYYINTKKAGLHIYVKSRCLDKYEYKKESQICLAIFAQIVDKYLNINLLEEGENVLDFHNTNLYQRFNLFYSSFKYNDYAGEFDLNMVTFEDLEKLVNKYDLKLDVEIRKTISPTLNNIGVGNGKRIKIDRNLHIGKYRGNDIRFRISVIADKIFGDNAKSFCDKFFYYENNKSIYNHWSSGNVVNPLIWKWLIKNNYIVESSQNIIKDWISEYKQKIIQMMCKYDHLQYVAPTGTGKTTFINDFLAKEFNAVVIVPFNVTNRLYDKLFEVNSLYVGEVPKNKPVVMIWDQAIKRWDEIKDRYIIIDESHTLFLDRTYRDSAIKLILKLKEHNCKTTFISATPAGEDKIFSDVKVEYFYKSRSEVNMVVNNVKDIEWAQYHYIKKAIDKNWYDKIILLDDSTAKKIYEKFVVEGYSEQISYIRSSTKESFDFIDLRENELLKKKLTICTCVAYNGLNFKNLNENILVVGSIKLGETTSNEMIQQIGRIRNSNVNAIYFYDADMNYYVDIDRRIERNIEKYNMHMPDFVDVDEKWLDANYSNARREIQEYQLEHSNMSKIIEELGRTGYIAGYVNEKDNDSKRIKMSLELKRKESDEMKEDIINGRFFGKEYESEYQRKWMKEINRLISNENYSGITIDMFIELFNNGTKKKLIETSIDNIKEIIRVLTVDDNMLDETFNSKEKYVNMLSDKIDKKQFLGNLKRMKEIKSKWGDKIYIIEDKIYFEDVVADVISMEEERQKKMIENGKNSSKKVKDLETGKIYDSASECANDIGKSNSYISKYKNRFITLE